MATYRIEIEDGAMTTAVAWENHTRGRNWLAIISPDPTQPGGLARTFITKAQQPAT
jgi:hypothetical protein